MQVSPELKAYRAAYGIEDDEKREVALRAYIQAFPQSQYLDKARSMLLTSLLKSSPNKTREIHALARKRIDTAKTEDRASTENEVAYQLAEAEPAGVDLKAAEHWSKQSIAANTLPAYTAKLKQLSQTQKFPMPTPDKVQHYWASEHSGPLQTLAEIYVDQGKLQEAQKVADTAHALDAEDGLVFVTIGEVDHARHEDPAALEALERAQMKGSISPRGQALMTKLYANAHPDDPGGLVAVLDKRYRELPKPHTPTSHAAPTRPYRARGAVYRNRLRPLRSRGSGAR